MVLVANSEFLSIDLSDGTRLSFSDFDEIQTWLDKENAALQWLFEGAPHAGGGVANLREQYIQGMNNVRQWLQNWRANPENSECRQTLHNFFSNLYSNQNIVRSDHAFAKIGAEAAAKDGVVAGAAALGLLLGIPSNIGFETTKGIVAATLKRDGIDPKSPSLVAAKVNDLAVEYARVAEKQKSEWKGISSEANAHIVAIDRSFQDLAKELSSKVAETMAALTSNSTAAVEEIETTERAYKEQMRLQAPVAYWESKAAVHRKALWWSRWRLVLFVVFGSGGLVLGLVELANRASELAARAPHDAIVYLKFSAIGVVITTIVLMVGRMLLRIYLSDRHLLTDAEERIAMIQTYLALSTEGKVGETDRSLILAPLFKSAADGIVKDEGMDASIVALLAKGIEKIR